MSRGVLFALSAYVLWGLSPIFWKQIDDVGAGDTIAFRVLATALVLLAVHAMLRTFGRVSAAAADPRIRLVAVTTAALLSANWLVFVWAVNHERVLETSLGYFMNPLASVVLGVVVLGERMRPLQWGAVGLAAVGVVVLTIDLGELPWVSLLLAATFAVYGLLRKTSPVGSLDGLSLEVSVMVPVAAIVVALRASGGDGVVGLHDPGRDLLLLGTGLMTAAPLLLFASGARRIDLTTVGLLQYVAPTIQFLLGVFVYDETWTGGQVAGYALIWLALAAFAGEGLAQRRAGPVVRPAVR